MYGLFSFFKFLQVVMAKQSGQVFDVCKRIPDPVSCRCPEPRLGLLETPPRWHVTIFSFPITYDILDFQFSNLKIACFTFQKFKLFPFSNSKIFSFMKRAGNPERSRICGKLPWITKKKLKNICRNWRILFKGRVEPNKNRTSSDNAHCQSIPIKILDFI